MSPRTFKQAGAGATPTYPLDTIRDPFSVSLSVVASGTVNYTVEYTYDNVQANGWTAATGTWFPHPDLTGLTANADGNIAFPVSAVRLLVNSGTGQAALTVYQSGP